MTWVDSLARLVEAFVSVESISDLRELMGERYSSTRALLGLWSPSAMACCG
jgi:hypothetical protein